MKNAMWRTRWLVLVAWLGLWPAHGQQLPAQVGIDYLDTTVSPPVWQPVTPAKPLPAASPAASLAAYSAASVNQSLASAATDVWCLRGAANKVIKLQGVRISGTASSNAVVPALLVKRSTANSGGTSSAVTAVAHDPVDAAAAGSVVAYSANPTAGALVGAIRGEQVLFAGSSAPNLVIEPVVYQFSVYDGKVPTLRSASDSICVNLNAQTVAGGAISVDAQWTEE